MAAGLGAPEAITVAAIYIVDDHQLLRSGLRAVLESAGHRVVGESADPTQALAELRVLAPALLLLDLHLQAHSGFELLERLGAHAPGVRTIVLTMSTQPRDVATAWRLGARAYVLKGASARELLAAVDDVLQGRMHRSPGLAAPGPYPGDEGAGGLAALSARERQVLLSVVRGRSSSAIGAQLELSPKTVDSYRSRLMTKLGVADVPALVRLAVREGWIDSAGD